jgi:hypothetical protein
MHKVASVFAFFVGSPALSRKTAAGAGAAIIVLLAGVTAGAAEPAATTSQLAAQSRARIVVHPRKTTPGPNAKRHCKFWLAKEYRPSGTVITPQMRCWWQ